MTPGRDRRAARFRSFAVAAALLASLAQARAEIPLRADTLGAGSRDSSSSAPDSLEPVNTTRLTIVAGAMAAAMVGIHLYQESGWWKYNRAPFHFREDLTYGRSVDKIGHFYGTMLWSYSLRKVLLWAGVPGREAMFYGSAGALAFQTFLEVEDGFSTWGFDRLDFLCDLGGALWPIAQHHSGALRAVDLKLSYKPSSLLNTSAGGGFAGQKHLVMDDYEGQTYWLSLPPEQLLPGPAARLWPDFLRVAVGYGVRDVSGAGGDPYSVVFIGLDYDMKKIIPQTSSFLVTLSEVLDFIHFPAPAVRISPTAVLYGIYY
jgi:hypothetical protein